MAFNPLYLLLIVPALLAWLAQARVRKVYDRYGKLANRRNVDGLEVAQRLLSAYGLTDVKIERTPGYLTDHYDPQAKTLRLSDGIANADSITALGVVAHEVGHAIQDAEGYRFMQLRTKMGERVNQVAQWVSFAFIGGMLLGIPILMALSGLFLGVLVVFTLVTLPVERDASNRALTALQQAGLAGVEESRSVREVLRAAAFTYLSSLGQRLGTFLFFVAMIFLARGSAGA
ncbi:MAG: zinc metallopeptidase [Anaerolineae bacterium]|nr:zinc metallopeptidase [Anaerolineae bacterium]